MFGLFKSSEHQLNINDAKIVDTTNKETILDAALREGLNFPHSCKVGGCATCKCKLEKGKVRELTDAAYILSAEDLDAGYILACQSIPKTDVQVSLNLANAAARQISGKIVAQNRLTENLVEIVIKLNEAMRFQPGQYGILSIADNSDVARPYSFANLPRGEMNEVRFFIKTLEGGKLSNRLYFEDLIDQSVTVEGPLGDFCLQANNKSALFIATGSGLAPILSILEEIRDKGEHKNAVLLFGAKTQEELYVLDEIKAIAGDWVESFTFVPTLSQELDNTDWQGRRGHVTQIISDYVSDDCEAYLCGSPVMVDDCERELKKLGVSGSQIYADRFLPSS